MPPKSTPITASLSTTIWLTRFLMLFPIEQISENKDFAKYQSCLPLRVIGIIVVFAYCGLTYKYTFPTLEGYIAKSQKKISDAANLFLPTLIALLILTTAQLYVDQLGNVLNELNRVDREMQKLKVKLDKGRLTRWINISWAVCLALLALLEAILVFNYVNYESEENEFLMVKAVGLIPLFVVWIFSTQFSTFLLSLKFQFDVLNKNLQRLEKETNINDEKEKDEHIPDQNGNNPSLIEQGIGKKKDSSESVNYGKTNNFQGVRKPFSKNFKQNEINDANNYHDHKKTVWSTSHDHISEDQAGYEIIYIASMHYNLSQILKHMNWFFSVQVLCLVGNIFVFITMGLYSFYERFSGEDPVWTYNFAMEVLSEVTWVVSFTIILMIIISLCFGTASNANSASYYLHKIDLTNKNEDFKAEVESFSLQLLHDEVKLTAGGFFPVDFTLLYTIMSAVTTYLVILIQFRITDSAMGHGRSRLNQSDTSITTTTLATTLSIN